MSEAKIFADGTPTPEHVRTVFYEHCRCCKAEAVVTYIGEKFHSRQCGCPLRIGIKAHEDAHFVAKIRAWNDPCDAVAKDSERDIGKAIREA